MNRSIRIPIKESAEELKQMYIQETDKRRAERVQFLYLLKTEQITSLSHGTQLLIHHRHTLSRWLSSYENGGLEQLLERESPPGRPVSVSGELQKLLEDKLSTNGFESYKDAHAFMQQHGYTGDYNSALHYLKKHQETRIKVTRPQHIKQDKEARDAFKKTLVVSSVNRSKTLPVQILPSTSRTNPDLEE